MGIFKELFARFSGLTAEPPVRPSLGIPTPKTPRETLRPFVQKSMSSLGLISPSEEEWVLDLFCANQSVRPEGVALISRKSPDQMSIDEKRAIGINPKAFMSHSYYAKLSEKGKASPLDALDATLSLCSFLAYHARDIENMKRAGCTHATAAFGFPDECKACKKIIGKKFRIDDIPQIPLPGCEMKACAISFSPVIKD